MRCYWIWFAIVPALLVQSVSAEDFFSGEMLYQEIEHLASMGDHRTGTEGDLRTTRWLADELDSAGLDVEQQPFSLQQFFPEKTELLLGEMRISAFPHWFPTATTNEGITAPIKALAEVDLNGAIAYVSSEAAGLWYKADISAFADQAVAKGALALVVAVPHPSGTIYARNGAEPYLQQRLPIPAVIIAATDSPKLDNWSSQVTLRSTGRYESQAQAYNVKAQLRASNPAAQWIIVTTPSSGWFSTTGERGGGVALFLALSRWAASESRQHHYLFIANSGHELDFMGAHHSIPTVPAADQVALWLHLGASIATRQWQETEQGLQPLAKAHEHNFLYGDKSQLGIIKLAFKAVPDLQIAPNEKLNRTTSEMGVIVSRGYTAMGMVGAHRFFHTPLDLPNVTDPLLLAPYGEAFRQLFETIDAQQ